MTDKIAILGFGTVGSGVYDMLKRNLLPIKAVFDKEEKRRELGSLLVTDVSKIMEDPEISLVVECLGGDTLPYRCIKEALTHKKNVVSSNKETISRHYEEYLRLARENHVAILFEASVGGGIPLLGPINRISSYDEIERIEGILNGTTNYILTQMQGNDMGFSQALALAQKLGFAEKDPTADLEGLDMVRKSSILSAIGFKQKPDNDKIHHFGITNLKKEDLKEIVQGGRVLRFTSHLRRIGDEFEAYVMPSSYPLSHLANVNYETNCVLCNAKYNGPVCFIGKGAGKYPTASAILQDVTSILEGKASSYPSDLKALAYRDYVEGKVIAYDGEGRKILVDPKFSELEKYRLVIHWEENQ